MGIHSKRDNEEYQLLVAEAAFFAENKQLESFSDKFPANLVTAIGGLGAGGVGAAVLFSTFAGLSGAEIMGGLAAYAGGSITAGGAGVAAGIGVAAAAYVLAPIVVVGGILQFATSQRKLGNELVKLMKLGASFEKKLQGDDRENAQKLVLALKAYREKLEKKHPDIMVISV
jgi:hypothetical protein